MLTLFVVSGFDYFLPFLLCLSLALFICYWLHGPNLLRSRHSLVLALGATLVLVRELLVAVAPPVGTGSRRTGFSS